MPLHHSIKGNAFILGVWRLTEPLEEVCAHLPRRLVDEAEHRFSAPHRRQEWLGVRLLLQTLMGELPEVAYHESGRPYLPLMGGWHISISHTKGYVAAVVGQGVVGIDIEQVSERVHKVASRFVRPDEEAADTSRLLLHWSAKETLYKCLDCDAVDFREHLHILPFIPQAEGSFTAREYRTPFMQRFMVHYKVERDFVLTYIV